MDVHRHAEVANVGVAVGHPDERVLGVVGVADAGRQVDLIGDVIDAVGEERVVVRRLAVVQVVVVKPQPVEKRHSGALERSGRKGRQPRRRRPQGVEAGVTVIGVIVEAAERVIQPLDGAGQRNFLGELIVPGVVEGRAVAERRGVAAAELVAPVAIRGDRLQVHHRREVVVDVARNAPVVEVVLVGDEAAVDRRDAELAVGGVGVVGHEA